MCRQTEIHARLNKGGHKRATQRCSESRGEVPVAADAPASRQTRYTGSWWLLSRDRARSCRKSAVTHTWVVSTSSKYSPWRNKVDARLGMWAGVTRRAVQITAWEMQRMQASLPQVRLLCHERHVLSYKRTLCAHPPIVDRWFERPLCIEQAWLHLRNTLQLLFTLIHCQGMPRSFERAPANAVINTLFPLVNQVPRNKRSKDPAFELLVLVRSDTVLVIVASSRRVGHGFRVPNLTTADTWRERQQDSVRSACISNALGVQIRMKCMHMQTSSTAEQPVLVMCSQAQ